jgi:predicted nucleic acid-binding protein
LTNIYLDANVYLDYWEDRRDNLRPLGEFACSLMRRAINCEFVVCYSELVFFEVSKSCSIPKEEVFEQMFRPLEQMGKLRLITYTYEPEATLLAQEKKIPKNDAIHLILSEKCNAILVSRDNHHLALRDQFKIMKPEEF